MIEAAMTLSGIVRRWPDFWDERQASNTLAALAGNAVRQGPRQSDSPRSSPQARRRLGIPFCLQLLLYAERDVDRKG